MDAAALYFPRSRDEEVASQIVTAGEQLDEFGDLLLGRNMSIGRMPSDTAAIADAGRSGSTMEEGAAEQTGGWNETLLRCDRTLFIVDMIA